MRFPVRLFNRMRALPKPVKASICFAICTLFQKGVLFLTTPIFTRLLSTDQYGMYSLYASWLSLITVICTLNLNQNAFFKGATDFAEEKDSFVSSLQGLTTLIALIVFSTFLLTPQTWELITGLNHELIFCMFLEVLFLPSLSFWFSKQRAEYKYIASSILTILMLIASTGIAIFAVWLTDYGVLARVYPVVFIDVCVGLFFYIWNTIRGKRLISGKFWKFALLFSFPLLPHYLADMILSQADRVMISNLCGVSYTAVYSVAYAVAMLVSLVNSSISASLVPWTYEKLKNCSSESENDLKKIATLLSVVIAALSCVIVAIGPEIISIMGPEEYSEAIWIMPPVGMSVLLMFYVRLFTNVETYYGKNQYVAFVSLMGALVNIVLNAIFLPKYGFLAAGWTTLVSYCFMSLGHYLFMKRIRKSRGLVSSVYDGKMLLLVALFGLIFSIIMLVLYQMIIVRYLAVILMALIAVMKRRELKNAFFQLKN